MKNKTYTPNVAPELTYLFVALLLALSLTLVRAAPPVAGTAVNAAGNLGVGLGAGNPGLGAAGAINSASGVRGAGSAQGAGAFSAGGNAGSAFDTSESIGMRQARAQAAANTTSTGLNNAEAHASVMGQAHGLSVATLAAGGASASLDTDDSVHAIQAQAMDSRTELLAELHTRVEASTKAMVAVRKSGAKLDTDDKAKFNAAAADVKVREKALQKSLKAAEKADATTWVAARAKLADDYGAYASAVAHAETASRLAAKAGETPKS